jgi:hypothetical protein
VEARERLGAESVRLVASMRVRELVDADQNARRAGGIVSELPAPDRHRGRGDTRSPVAPSEPQREMRRLAADAQARAQAQAPELGHTGVDLRSRQAIHAHEPGGTDVVSPNHHQLSVAFITAADVG